MYHYRARLTQYSSGLNPIYDGDTVHLTIDYGFELIQNVGPCRLFGIDTPEVNRKASKEAGIAARDYVRAQLEPLDWFEVYTIKDKKGKYGRYLVRIMLPDGTCLNDELVRLGHAVEKEY